MSIQNTTWLPCAERKADQVEKRIAFAPPPKSRIPAVAENGARPSRRRSPFGTLGRDSPLRGRRGRRHPTAIQQLTEHSLRHFNPDKFARPFPVRATRVHRQQR